MDIHENGKSLDIEATFVCDECGNEEVKTGAYQGLVDEQVECPNCGAILN